MSFARTASTLATAFALLLPAPAEAETSTSSAAPGVEAITLDDSAGFFVPSQLFADMERAFDQVPALERELAAEKERADHLGRAASAFARSSSAALTLADDWERRAARAFRREAQLEAELDAARRWDVWRSLLWIGAGIVLTIGAGWAIGQAR